MPTDLEVLRSVPAEEVASWSPENRALYLAQLDRAALLETPDRMGERFIHSFVRYRHIKIMGEAIRAMVMDDDCDILLIETSVRHGKSWLCSIAAPVWFLCNFPEKTVGLASYEADFAADFGRGARNAMNLAAPQFGLEVDKTSKAAHRWRLILPNGRTGGGMWTAGAGGPIEGKGYELGIVDDPIKNPEEANNPEHLDKVWEWWQGTFIPRANPGAKRIVVMSRWSDEDLTGRLKMMDGNLRVKSLPLPAVADEDEDYPVGRFRWTRAEGEALCPERYPIPDLELLREGAGERVWASRYQQRPMPADGGMFRKKYFRYWTPTDSGALLDLGHDKLMVNLEDCYRFSTADMAFTRNKRSDWTVACQWAVTPEIRSEDGTILHPPYLLLVDRDRVRIEAAEHLPLLQRAWEFRPKPSWVGVEKTNGTLGLINMARNAGILIRELEPGRNKQARAEVAASLTEASRAFFPRRAKWIDEWESELMAFGAGAAHDDQVDNFAYAAAEVVRGSVNGRRQKKNEPQTLEEKVRQHAMNKSKKSRSNHPILGRI